MKEDVSTSAVVDAVVAVIEKTFDRSNWTRLGVLTDTRERIKDHGRLLRSLDFGDSDYLECIYDVIDEILDRQKPKTGRSLRGPEPGIYSLRNFDKVAKYIDFEAKLKKINPELYDKLFDGGPSIDSRPVDSLDATSMSLKVPDIAAHARRIRAGLAADPAQAIGSAKELLETVFKAILDLHGNGPETNLDMPVLLRNVQIKLELHPGGVSADQPGARQRKALLQGMTHMVTAAAELRNGGFGTGHGGSRREELDVPTANLVVTAAVAVANFFAEAAQPLA